MKLFDKKYSTFWQKIFNFLTKNIQLFDKKYSTFDKNIQLFNKKLFQNMIIIDILNIFKNSEAYRKVNRFLRRLFVNIGFPNWSEIWACLKCFYGP